MQCTNVFEVCDINLIVNKFQKLLSDNKNSAIEYLTLELCNSINVISQKYEQQIQGVQQASKTFVSDLQQMYDEKVTELELLKQKSGCEVQVEGEQKMQNNKNEFSLVDCSIQCDIIDQLKIQKLEKIIDDNEKIKKYFTKVIQDNSDSINDLQVKLSTKDNEITELSAKNVQVQENLITQHQEKQNTSDKTISMLQNNIVQQQKEYYLQIQEKDKLLKKLQNEITELKDKTINHSQLQTLIDENAKVKKCNQQLLNQVTFLQKQCETTIEQLDVDKRRRFSFVGYQTLECSENIDEDGFIK